MILKYKYLSPGGVSEAPIDNELYGRINKARQIIPEILPQVQSDWSQTDTSQPDYIQNKPDVYTKNEIDSGFVTISTTQTIDSKKTFSDSLVVTNSLGNNTRLSGNEISIQSSDGSSFIYINNNGISSEQALLLKGSSNVRIDSGSGIYGTGTTAGSNADNIGLLVLTNPVGDGKKFINELGNFIEVPLPKDYSEKLVVSGRSPAGIGGYNYVLSTPGTMSTSNVDFGLPTPTTRINQQAFASMNPIIVQINNNNVVINSEQLPIEDLDIQIRY